MAFKYGDRVRIIKGFWKDFEGYLVDSRKRMYIENEYYIECDFRKIKTDGLHLKEWFIEEFLEKI